MRIDDIAPRVFEVESKVKQNKSWSALSMAFSAIVFSFIAGMAVQQGIQRFLHKNSDYEWISDLLMGLAYLLISIVWVVRLSSKPRDAMTSSAPPNQ